MAGHRKEESFGNDSFVSKFFVKTVKIMDFSLNECASYGPLFHDPSKNGLGSNNLGLQLKSKTG